MRNEKTAPQRGAIERVAMPATVIEACTFHPLPAVTVALFAPNTRQGSRAPSGR